MILRALQRVVHLLELGLQLFGFLEVGQCQFDRGPFNCSPVNGLDKIRIGTCPSCFASQNPIPCVR